MRTAQPQVEIRRAEERGRTELGWLHSRHSFSFGRYSDPRNVGYRALRVLNDDVVEPAAGFGEHAHDNMEILTWVLDGALKHVDSTGTNGVIRPGDLQVMSAGRGVFHSEMNASDTQRVHFLQIWIEPDESGRNVKPSYSQKTFSAPQRRGRWQTLASPDGRDASLRIHHDATLRVAELGPGQSAGIAIDDGRHAYLHVAFGAVRAGELDLSAGDAVKIAGRASLDIRANEESQVLFFDLA